MIDGIIKAPSPSINFYVKLDHGKPRVFSAHMRARGISEKAPLSLDEAYTRSSQDAPANCFLRHGCEKKERENTRAGANERKRKIKVCARDVLARRARA